LSLLRRLRFGLRSRFRRATLEEELEEELRLHLELESEQNQRHGMDAAAARCAAEARLGEVDRIKDACRDSWGRPWLDSVAWDSRIGLRGLRRNPGYAAAAVVTLALGIGANTAVFSVVNAVLIRPLPFHESERLMIVRQQIPEAGISTLDFSVPEIQAYRERSRGLDGLVEYHELWFTLLGDGPPERVRTGIVSASFFDVVGVGTSVGRTFLPGEDQSGAEPVLVLSHDFWLRHYDADPNVIGRRIEMNDRPHTIVGVLAPIPHYPRQDDVYMPTSACPFRRAAAEAADPDVRMVPLVLGRLRADVAPEDAAAELTRIAREQRARHPAAYPRSGEVEVSLRPLRGELTRTARPLLLALLATAGLVLLNAAANVANLSLARLLRRERELAVRRALGASRRRLAGQLFTESLLLSGCGAGLGLALAFVGQGALVAYVSRFTPRATEVTIDGTVLLFTIVVALVTAGAFGSLPVVPWGERLARALGDGPGGPLGRRRRLQRGLIASQLAASFVLLAGAGLMTRQLLHLLRVDPGFDHENVLAMDVDLDITKYPGLDGVADFYDSLLERIEATPGVRVAAVARTFPLNESGQWSGRIETESQRLADDEVRPQVAWRVASPHYFETMRIPLVAGRSFDEGDGPDAPAVAIVNQSLARHYFGEGCPLGRRLTPDRGRSWLRIVGVVGDVRQRLEERPADEVYRPYAQQPTWQASILVRTAAEPMEVAESVREAVYAADPRQPVSSIRTLEEVRRSTLAPPGLTALLMGLFALLALAITATGIGGAVAYSVSERRREIGLRMALGAQRRRVLGMLLSEGLSVVGVGLALGLVGLYGLGELGLGPVVATSPAAEPLTLALVAGLLSSVAVAACLVPARKAAAADPGSLLDG